MSDFNVEKIKQKVLVRYPLFGSITSNVNLIITNDIEIAATDGYNVYFNPNAMSGYTVDEQIFIFAHEICHIALDHINRRKNRDQKLWNRATDAAINANLEQDGMIMPSNAVKIVDAISKDADEIYEQLLKEKNKRQENGIPEPEYENGFDNHDVWDRQPSNSQTKSTDKETKRNIFKRIFKNRKDDSNSALDEATKKKKHVDEQSKKLSSNPKTIFEKNKNLRNKNINDMIQKISNNGFGTNVKSVQSEINLGSVGTQKSILDLRSFLGSSVSYEVDWSYRDAELSDGIIKPGLEIVPILEVEILLDTSGSVNDELLRCFLRECKNILRDSQLKVGCFDTKFYGFNKIRTESDIDNMTFVGRGGTNFNAAVNAFSNRGETKIIFTDGDAEMPSKAIDAIWVVFGNKKINPPGGSVIYVDKEAFKSATEFNPVGKKTM